MVEPQVGSPPVSIHAPLHREERRLRDPPPISVLLVSIHAPLHREERLKLDAVITDMSKVSIHAPLHREERRLRCFDSVPAASFNPRPSP